MTYNLERVALAVLQQRMLLLSLANTYNTLYLCMYIVYVMFNKYELYHIVLQHNRCLIKKYGA
jgi:hypothetical protein